MAEELCSVSHTLSLLCVVGHSLRAQGSFRGCFYIPYLNTEREKKKCFVKAISGCSHRTEFWA